MRAEAKLKELGLTLGPRNTPAGNYVEYVQVGNMLYLAGHGARPYLDELGGMKLGPDGMSKVGRDYTVEEAYKFARYTGLNLIATMKEALGDLDRVKRVVSVFGMVNSTDNFGEHPAVINGCTDLFVEVWGDAGRPSRSAVGMYTLRTPIEIEAIVEVE